MTVVSWIDHNRAVRGRTAQYWVLAEGKDDLTVERVSATVAAILFDTRRFHAKPGHCAATGTFVGRPR